MDKVKKSVTLVTTAICVKWSEDRTLTLICTVSLCVYGPAISTAVASTTITPSS